ncbi:MAG: hypothetical protein IKD79_07430 [Oscillospiraceae bacterium]|nr:hypothetical protein [Oscillospiraceae bacterium]
MPEGGAHETAGQQFVKRIRPAGCALFLALAVLVTVICFTSGRDPIPGYEAPRDTEYYAAHLQELAEELEENVFPALTDCSLTAEAGEENVTVTVVSGNLAAVRSALLRYFDQSLLEFRRG